MLYLVKQENYSKQTDKQADRQPKFIYRLLGFKIIDIQVLYNLLFDEICGYLWKAIEMNCFYIACNKCRRQFLQIA